MTFDLTQIILALITLLSLCGWFVNGRKHRKETEAIDADNRQKEFELGRQYIGEFKENIVKPLQTEMKGLKNEVKKLHKAIDHVNDCSHRDNCPVRAELQKQQAADDNNPEK